MSTVNLYDVLDGFLNAGKFPLKDATGQRGLFSADEIAIQIVQWMPGMRGIMSGRRLAPILARNQYIERVNLAGRGQQARYAYRIDQARLQEIMAERALRQQTAI